MRPEEEGSSEERETLLSGREIWPGPPEGFQKGSPNSPVEYVWIFICPDGSTLQHPVPEPYLPLSPYWGKIARNVLAFAVKVVL